MDQLSDVGLSDGRTGGRVYRQNQRPDGWKVSKRAGRLRLPKIRSSPGLFSRFTQQIDKDFKRFSSDNFPHLIPLLFHLASKSSLFFQDASAGRWMEPRLVIPNWILF